MHRYQIQILLDGEWKHFYSSRTYRRRINGIEELIRINRYPWNDNPVFAMYDSKTNERLILQLGD